MPVHKLINSEYTFTLPKKSVNKNKKKEQQET